jgi:hypothetical protein
VAKVIEHMPSKYKASVLEKNKDCKNDFHVLSDEKF